VQLVPLSRFRPRRLTVVRNIIDVYIQAAVFSAVEACYIAAAFTVITMHKFTTSRVDLGVALLVCERIVVSIPDHDQSDDHGLPRTAFLDGLFIYRYFFLRRSARQGCPLGLDVPSHVYRKLSNLTYFV